MLTSIIIVTVISTVYGVVKTNLYDGGLTRKHL